MKPAADGVTAVMLEQNEVFPSGTTSDVKGKNTSGEARSSGHVLQLCELRVKKHLNKLMSRMLQDDFGYCAARCLFPCIKINTYMRKS